MSEANTPEYSKKPGTQETLPCFLGRDLDERCSSECDAAQVSKDIIGDDHGNGQNEPDEALENVVDNEMCLTNNEEQGHMGPCKLGELELVVALLECGDKEDKA